MTEQLRIVLGFNNDEINKPSAHAGLQAKQEALRQMVEQETAIPYSNADDLLSDMQSGHLNLERVDKAQIAGSQLELCVATAAALFLARGVSEIIIDPKLNISGPEYDGRPADLAIVPRIVRRKLVNYLHMCGQSFDPNNWQVDSQSNLIRLSYTPHTQ